MHILRISSPLAYGVRIGLLGFLLFLFGSGLRAEGTVTHLSGPVQVQQIDGRLVASTVGAKVNEGETLVTGKAGYARLEMTDGGEMVLRPESQLKIESYRFEKSAPASDNSIFRMIQGGLRAITGLVSKRGNRDAYKLITPTATVGIRGTQFDVRVCEANCGSLADGTYVAVRSGAIVEANNFGELALSAGQVGFAPPTAAPVRLPRDPGIGFTPPPGIPKLDEKKKLEAAAAAASPGGDQSASGGTASNAPSKSTKEGSSPLSVAEGTGEVTLNAQTQASGLNQVQPQDATAGPICSVQ
jgi:hypothetical protein